MEESKKRRVIIIAQKLLRSPGHEEELSLAFSEAMVPKSYIHHVDALMTLRLFMLFSVFQFT
jgi:hypothetical protein